VDASRTLVVIPAHDEEETLPGVLRALRRATPGLDALVVDDGSTDATARVARREGALLVRLPFNLGIGGALRCGFRFALERGYSRAVQLDADGQHDPAEIPLLLSGFGGEDGRADMVVGSRFADRSHAYAVGRVRGVAMGVLRHVVRMLTGQPFTDTSSGFRAFDRGVLELFAREYPAEYMESVESLVLALSAGFRVREVPVRMTPRAAGRPTTRPLRQAYHYLRALLVIAATARRHRPAQAPALTGSEGLA
jgi:glycosyltransferase involved in cell wall biosynthesis